MNPHREGSEKGPDVLVLLLALNEMVYARIEAGEAVTVPGISPDYPDPKSLVSAGCVQPREGM